MSFLNPALLWFAGLASIPVLIYLFHRQRYTVMDWAAMEFLRRAVSRNRRRLKLENILLLLLRVLAVLLLVLAVSRPVLEQARALFAGGEGRRDVLIAVDASYSMQHRQGARTAFDRAREAASGMIEALLEPGDRVALARLAERTQFVYEDPIFVDEKTGARLERDIADFEPAATPGDITRTLTEIQEYLPRFQGGAAAVGGARPEVFILTDMQRSSFVSPEGRLLDPGVAQTVERLEKAGAAVTFIDCGAEDRANCAVTDLALDDPIAGVDAPIRLVASVVNHGDEPATGLALELFVDDLLNRSVPLEFEAGESRQVELSAVVQEPGAHHARVTLRSDALALDNTRAVAFEARAGVGVLLVDGEPGGRRWEGETDFLAAALSPGRDDHLGGDSIFRPRVVSEADLADIDLAESQVIVIANVIALPGEQAARIEAWVRRGGALLIATGHQVDATVWNEALWRDGEGCLPARLGETVITQDQDSYYKLRADTFRHPVLQPFEPRGMRQLILDPRWVGYTRVELPEGGAGRPDLDVLASFEGRRLTRGGATEESTETAGLGDPAVVERRFGRGRVVLYASSLDAAWSNFYYKPSYLIFWRRMVTHLAGSGVPERNLLVGMPFEQVLGAAEYAPEISLVTPGGEEVDKTLERLEGEEDRFRLTHAATEAPGIYSLRFRRRAQRGAGATGAAGGEERRDAFAVNVDTRRESGLGSIDADELGRLLPGWTFQVRAERGAASIARGGDDTSGDGEVWRGLLLLALLLLLLESFIGCWFGRRAVK